MISCTLIYLCRKQARCNLDKVQQYVAYWSNLQRNAIYTFKYWQSVKFTYLICNTKFSIDTDNDNDIFHPLHLMRALHAVQEMSAVKQNETWSRGIFSHIIIQLSTFRCRKKTETWRNGSSLYQVTGCCLSLPNHLPFLLRDCERKYLKDGVMQWYQTSQNIRPLRDIFITLDHSEMNR